MATGTEIMLLAGYVLNDEDSVRWTAPELCRWINDACSAIVLVRPAAKSGSRVLTLAIGTLQSVPATAGSPPPLKLLDITRNLASDADPRVGGRHITIIGSKALGAIAPYWHDPAKTPFKVEAKNFIFNEANPLEFFVYPGNTGAGFVEAVCSEMPETLVVDDSQPEDAISSYSSVIDLPAIYDPVVLDYVLYRAFSKDDSGSQAGRAAAHYGQFANAMGITIQTARASSPNNRRADL